MATKIVLLINKNDILKRTSLGGSIDIDKLVPHINNAQEVELIRLLGSALYKKIIQLVGDNEIDDPANVAYATLFYDYIKPTLVFFTMEYFLPFHQYQLANAGISRPTGENIETITKEEVDFLNKKFRNLADGYANSMDDYLCLNETSFPELNTANQEKNKASATYRCGIYLD